MVAGFFFPRRSFYASVPRNSTTFARAAVDLFAPSCEALVLEWPATWHRKARLETGYAPFQTSEKPVKPEAYAEVLTWL